MLLRVSSVTARRCRQATRRQWSTIRSFSAESAQAGKEEAQTQNSRVLMYAASTVIGFFGLTYASVPLYQAFCQATGFGGTTQRIKDLDKLKNLKPVGERMLRITFNCDVSSSMPWKFKPQQPDIKVVPGETALAFYTAENKTNKAITGVATYNVTPMKAGLYFNKIQCFCFEQQRLRPKEKIDMPVFFYIDPEFLEDPSMDGVNDITLSYTFFKTNEEECEEDIMPNSADAKQERSPDTKHNQKHDTNIETDTKMSQLDELRHQEAVFRTQGAAAAVLRIEDEKRAIKRQLRAQQS